FFLGVGVGNAHDSFDPAMNGAYATSQFEDVAAKSTGLSGVIWELGFGGLGLLIWFLLMLFKDAIHFAKEDGLFGAFSLSMLMQVAIFALTFFYFFVFDINIILIYFSLMAGIIAAGDRYKHEWRADRDS
ncbi:MAG: hypothetical protein H7832_14355, partial [Magnetococcus sp. DMHC-6]